MFGLPAALTFESASRGVLPRNLLKHVRPLVTVQVAIIVLVYSFVSFVVLKGRVPVEAALVALVVLPAMVVYAYQLALLQGRHQFRELHVLRGLPAALFAVGLLAGVATGGRSLLMVISLWTASSVLAVMVSSVYLRWRWRANLVDEFQEVQQVSSLGALSRFGAVGFLGSASLVEMLRVDQLMVGLILTTTDLGLYMVSLALCSVPLFLAQGLGLVAYPRIASVRSYGEKRRLTVRYTLIGAAVCGAVCGVLALAASPVIQLLFGPEFAGAIAVSQILLAATAVVCVRRLLSDGMRGANAPSAGSFAEVASLVTLVPMALLLAPSFGLIGFCWAMVASYGVGLITITLLFSRANRAYGKDVG
jgi:O-antigen/teichoic acid export membrane protein